MSLDAPASRKRNKYIDRAIVAAFAIAGLRLLGWLTAPSDPRLVAPAKLVAPD